MSAMLWVKKAKKGVIECSVVGEKSEKGCN